MKPIVSHPQVEFSIGFTMVYTMVYHIQSWILPEESPTISSIGTFWIETRLAAVERHTPRRHVGLLRATGGTEPKLGDFGVANTGSSLGRWD